MTQSRGTHAPEEVESGATLGQQIRLGASIAAIAALVLFFLQNLQEVEMHFLWFDWDTRLIFALVASSGLGALAAWLTSAIRRRGRRAQRVRE
jgi:uncharacterized integral membrane protein